MQTSDRTEAIDVALAAAQAEIRNPAKNHKNPHFKNKYADLTDGLDVIRPTLSKHGIAVIQATAFVDGFVTLVTRLAFKGQWYQSTWPLGPAGNQQQLGAANTYARRYSLFALVGVAGDDDADGQEVAASVAMDRATGEAAAYVIQAEADLAAMTSTAAMTEWWDKEKTNRALHFQSADDVLLKRLKDSAAKRSKELAAPTP